MNKIIQMKIFKIEKYIIFYLAIFSILMALVANPNQLAANPRFNQPLEVVLQQSKVTLKITNKPVKTILAEIYRQTKINFIFKNEKELDALSNMSIDVKNATVKDALDGLFAKTQFTYKIEDNVVTIVRRATPTPAATKQARPERVLIIGKVLEKDTKKPIVGATVVVVGKPSGSITDAEGAFSFLADSNDVLEVSYIGKKTISYTKELKSNWAMIFEMENDIVAIEDVVVTGYSTISRADMVGSATTLKADDIRITGKANIAEMLQGQVAGMIVTNSSSRVGSTPTIQIRGQSTLASDLGNRNPIWVVDGVIQDEPIEMNAKMGLIDDMKTLLGNQVSWLNPSDIETVTVLKDASATAIYGSRASNGVIVVTTKKPKTEKVTINYSGSVSVNSKPKSTDFNYMNSQERILITEELFNSGLTYDKVPVKQYNTFDGILRSYIDRDITAEEYLKRRAELEVMNTDWFDLLTRTSVSQSHSVSLSGRVSNKLSVSASLGYTNNKGQELKNDMESLTSRISLNAEVTKRLRINFSINGSKSNNSATAASGSSGSGTSTSLDYAKNTSRSIPAYEEDGSNASYYVPSEYRYNNLSVLSYNYLNELNQTRATNVSGRISMALQANLRLTDWLSYEFSGSYSYNESARETFRSERSFSVARDFRGYDFGSVLVNSDEYKSALMPHGGTIDLQKATNNSYNIQNKLNFSKTVGKHRINAMFASEVRSNNARSNASAMWGYLPDRGNRFSKPPITIVPITGSYSANDYGLLSALFDGRYVLMDKTDNFTSLFATVAYSYDNRYVVNANVRNDMSNRFGQDINKRFDPTYSFGFKWSIANEPFLKDKMRWVTSLNLSATYGIQGNALLSKSADLILYKNGVSNHYNEFYSTIASIPNPYLTWERTTNWNFAVSGTLFKMFNLNVEYYTRKSKASVSQEIGFENGVSSMNLNGGIIYNNGIEGTVSFSPIATKDFGFNVSLNASKNWNKGGKTSLTDSQIRQIGTYLSPKTDVIVREGFPLGAFWSYEFSHLDDEKGYARFRRMDVDPAIATLDPTAILVYSGQSQPYITAGMNLALRYKNLTLGSSFAMIVGGKRRLNSPYSSLGAYKNKIPASEVNISKDLAKRWKKPGDELNTYYPGISVSLENIQNPVGQSTSSQTMWDLSDVRVVDGSFLRCNNIRLSYNFREKFLQKINLSNLTLSGSVSNPFVIGSKRFNGFDPELGDSVMPSVFSFSLNIGF